MTTAGIRIDESDPFGRPELDQLAQPQRSPCVSLYLPTHRAGADIEQDPIRLRNAVAAAERELVVLGWRAADAEDLLDPARQLIGDRHFWRHQTDGLALFIAPGVFRTFRVPTTLDEVAVVSTQFHLRPLLPLVGAEAFWLLALSQNAVRLFRGSRHAVAAVDTRHTPTSMAEALAHEDPEKQLQVRSAGPTSTARFHGHGGGDEDDKAALERYFRAVDRGLHDILLNLPAPLLLAGVSYYGPIYRSVSKHPRIIETVLAGNPENLSALELHERAWPLIETELSTQLDDLHDRYAQSRAAGRVAEGIAAVSAAATEGRIELLLLQRDHHCWAPHNQAPASEIHDERQPGDIDLLDEMALRTLRAGGDVIVIDDSDMPNGAIAAGVLRYPQRASPPPDRGSRHRLDDQPDVQSPDGRPDARVGIDGHLRLSGRGS